MIVLGIDSSASTSSAAVVGPGGAAVFGSREPRAHARVLPGLLDDALAAAPGPVDLVAVSRGPGLFTGMRVGLATASVFGWARGIPVVGVSTLVAVALRAVAGEQPAGPFTVALDARRREVFQQAFTQQGDPLGEPAVASPAEVVAEQLFADAGALRLGLPAVEIDTADLAREVALVAGARARAGLAQEPATPLYLRRPDVTPANPKPVVAP